MCVERSEEWLYAKTRDFTHKSLSFSERTSNTDVEYKIQITWDQWEFYSEWQNQKKKVFFSFDTSIYFFNAQFSQLNSIHTNLLRNFTSRIFFPIHHTFKNWIQIFFLTKLTCLLQSDAFHWISLFNIPFSLCLLSSCSHLSFVFYYMKKMCIVRQMSNVEFQIIWLDVKLQCDR